MSTILSYLQGALGSHATAAASKAGLNASSGAGAWLESSGSAAGGSVGVLPSWSLTGWAGVLLVAYLVYYNVAQLVGPKDPSAPPLVYHFFPIVGSAIGYGLDPYAFFDKNRRKYGDVFTFVLLKKRVTVALGPAGSNFVLNGKLSEVNAEEAYTRLTTPVFGEGVAYDVPNSVLVQQKKFIKYGLSTDNFKRYVPIIASEVKAQLNEVFKTGIKNQPGRTDALKLASEITICTASATLQGKEVRAALDKSFADLMHDLDGGFSPINFIYPDLPIPLNRRRDNAQKALSNFYLDIIKARRTAAAAGEIPTPEQESDMISALQNQVYKDGRPLSDREVAHTMIALLMAGQHTSAATGSWCLLHLADRPDVVDELRKEQEATYGRDEEGKLRSLDYEKLQTPLLNACIKETLRLHPPIHSILRVVTSPIAVPPSLSAPGENKTYVIPPRHYVLAAPGVSQMDTAIWRDASTFDPHRWLAGGDKAAKSDEESEQVDYGFGSISSGANSAYLPFGAGRHRCVGEQFAYVQLGTVIGTIIRECDIKPLQPFPPSDFTTMLVCPKEPRDLILTRRA